MKKTLNKVRGYLGNPNLKAIRQNQEMTPEQIEEFAKCAADVEYFVEKYMKIVHVDHGIIPLKMRRYQTKLVKNFQRNRFTITLCARQVGKTTMYCAFVLHYILFNQDKTVAILANKGKTAGEILSRIKLAYELLPLWMQHGVKEWNKGNIELENGCKVLAGSTSSSAIRGTSLSILIVDEAAFIPSKLWDEFYTSVYPTITSGSKTKVILVSTANGLNHFHKLWIGAKTGKNKYSPYEVSWKEVPGRDEKWKETEIANIGMEKFMQEQENQFLGSSNTLISYQLLQNLVGHEPVSVSPSGISIYEAPQKGSKYFVTVDTSRGLGNDYSALSVFKIDKYPFEQVATYRNNKIPPAVFPDLIRAIAGNYNNAEILVESNDIGGQVADILFYDLETENVLFTYKEGTKMSIGNGPSAQLGIRTTSSVKKLGCSILKDLVENEKLLVRDQTTVDEMCAFVKKGSSYEADDQCNDDMVMTTVLFAWASTQAYFKELVSGDSRKEVYGKHLQELEDDLLPIGFTNNFDFDEQPYQQNTRIVNPYFPEFD